MTRARVSERERIWSIESARGVAAVLVVLVHAGAFIKFPHLYGRLPFAGQFSWAHAGVDFFFVLSGFIITFAHFNDIGQPRALLRYSWRRISRVYFPYWILMLLVIPLYFVSPTVTRYEQHADVIFLSLVLFPLEQGPFYPIAWTLQHEVYFYLVFGLLILNRRLGLSLIVAVLALTFAFQVSYLTGLIADPPFLARFAFDVYNAQFLMGATAALVLRRYRIPAPLGILAAGIGVFVGAGMVEVNTPLLHDFDLRKIAYGCGAALMLLGLYESERVGALRMPKALIAVGTASYSIYLVHAVALMFAAKGFELTGLQRFVPAEAAYLLFVASAVAAGLAYGRFVERPVQTWARQVDLSRVGAAAMRWRASRSPG